jgi:preprotein translocase subunit SecD
VKTPLFLLVSLIVFSTSVIAGGTLFSIGSGQKFELTTSYIECIDLRHDSDNGDTVSVRLNPQGTEKWSKLTEANIGKPLVKTICGVTQAPTVMTKLTDSQFVDRLSPEQRKCLEASELKKCTK